MNYEDICKKIRGKGAGQDLYYQPVYDQIRSYIQAGDYASVRATTYEILTTSSKDLQILLWFCHAELTLKKITHFRSIFLLVEHFLNKFWEESFPQLKGDGLRKRQGMLESFFRGVLLWQSQQFLITKKQTITVSQFQIAAYEKDKGVASDTFQDIQKALAHLPKSSIQEHYNTLQECIQQCISFSKTLKKFNLSPGTFVKVGALFKLWIACFEIEKNSPLPDDAKNQEHALAPQANVSDDGTRTISDRHTAYKAIGEIAAYLKTLDPHSIVPEFLELLVQWENLTMAEILNALCNATQETKTMLCMLADATQSNNKARATT